MVMENLYDTKELSKLVGCTSHTIANWCKWPEKYFIPFGATVFKKGKWLILADEKAIKLLRNQNINNKYRGRPPRQNVKTIT